MEHAMELFDSSSRIAVLENEVKNIASDVKELRKEQKEQHETLMTKFDSMDERLGIVKMALDDPRCSCRHWIYYRPRKV